MRSASIPLTMRVVLAWSLPLLVTLVQWTFRSELDFAPWFLFYPVVFFAPMIGGLRGGLGATAIAALCGWYFFLPPQLSWSFDSAGGPLSILVFLGTGIVFSLFQQRLSDREEKYRTLFDRAGDGIVLIDQHGYVLDANPAYCALAGRPHSEIRGASLFDLVADFSPHDFQDVGARMAARSGATIERQLRRAGGTLLPIETVVTPLHDNQRLAIVRSVEERKRMEEALRQSENKFAKFFQSSPIPLSVSHLATGTIVDVNDAYVRQFGYSREELINRSTLELGILEPVDRTELIDALQREGRLQGAEVPVKHKSGEVRQCLSSSEILDLPGETLLLNSIVDITERKQAEEQLRASEERFRLVVQNFPNAISVWDAAGALQYPSPVVNTWLTASAPSLPPDDSALLPLESSAPGIAGAIAHRSPNGDASAGRCRSNWEQAVTAARHSAQHPGERVEIEISMPGEDGQQRELQVIFQGFQRASAGSEVVAITHDVSEHRRLQRLLQQANATLEQQVAELQRTSAAKDAFMASISHELRTPLMGVLTLSELLQAEVRGPLNPDQRHYVDGIYDSGQRLLTTINHVLLYTSLMAGSVTVQHEPCILAELSAIAVRSAAAAAGRKQHSLTRQVDPPDLVIESDADGILHVLKVLLDNAVKFTPDQGKINLSVYPVPDDGVVRITVSDTGIGMTEEEVSRLFAHFSQGDKRLSRRFEGLGLGLAYAAKMVELLGGTIAVQSTPGAGSHFTVTLPLRPAS